MVERDGALIVVDDERMRFLPGEKTVKRRVRFRTLGCWPLTGAIESKADDVARRDRRAARLRASSERAGPAGRCRAAGFHGTQEARGIFLMPDALRSSCERCPAARRRAASCASSTCGSVDDGKSTLIGRLINDTTGLLEDQIKVAASATRKQATARPATASISPCCSTGWRPNASRASPSMSPTASSRRRARAFIVADTPGHEQYTRNMATGASNAELAILLVDARKGLLGRPAGTPIIVSLLGIRHVVLAVNKIDLVDFVRGALPRDRRRLRSLRAPLDFHVTSPSRCRRASATMSSTRSERMPWYRGPTLLGHLETVETDPEAADGAVALAGAVGQPAECRVPRLRRHRRSAAASRSATRRGRRLGPDDRGGAHRQLRRRPAGGAGRARR